MSTQQDQQDQQDQQLQFLKEWNAHERAAAKFAADAAKARAWRVLRHTRVQSVEAWLDSPEGRPGVTHVH